MSSTLLVGDISVMYPSAFGGRRAKAASVQLLENRSIQVRGAKEKDSFTINLSHGFQCSAGVDGAEQGVFTFDVITKDGTRHSFACEDAIQQGRWIDAINALDVLVANVSAQRLVAEQNSKRDLLEAKVMQPFTASLAGFCNWEGRVPRWVDQALVQRITQVALAHHYKMHLLAVPPTLSRGQGGSSARSVDVTAPPGSFYLQLPQLPMLRDAGRIAQIAALSRSYGSRIELVIGTPYTGRDGQRGASGSHGSSGHSGSYGGGSGGAGGPGSDGQNGSPGEAGADAGVYDICILGGDSNQVQLEGSYRGTVTFKSPTGLVLVDAKGGDGGHGGDGGDGGHGGAGGAGGSGTTGHAGHDATSPGASGGRGGDGGPGGNGGPGGSGGDGGAGAPGGAAGAGGPVYMAASDPSLFALFVCDARAGFPGRAGVGGAAGIGGAGGAAGPGGAGGRGGHGGPSRRDAEGHIVVSAGMSGSSGSTGRPGHSGPSGRSGRSGQTSYAGASAMAGSLCYVVLDPSGQRVLEAAPTCFAASMAGFTIMGLGDRDDNVMEPGEHLVLSQITVCNDGDLTLPAGALVSFASTATVTFDEHLIVLPALGPHQSMVCDAVVGCTLFDVPPPTKPGAYKGLAEFSSSITMLGRPFFDGTLAARLDVEYPVRLVGPRFPTQMAISERNQLEVTVSNIGVHDMPTQVVLRIELGTVIVPILPDVERLRVAEGVLQLSVPLQPNGSFALAIPIELSAQAHLFERYPWRLAIIYNGKMIEFVEGDIRMAPVFLPNTNADRSADVLMITSPSMTRQDFLAYNRIVEALHLKVDYFDVERYGGISNTNPTWCGRYQGAVVLIPHSPEFLGQLSAADVLTHYFDSTFLDVVQSPAGLFTESSLVLADVEDGSLHVLFDALYAATRPFRFLGGDFSSRNVGKILEDDALEAAEAICKGLHEEDPLRFHRVRRIEYKPEKVGVLKTNYGACEIEAFPLPKSARLLAIRKLHVNVGVIQDGSFDPLTSDSIPVAHPLFSALAAIFSALSFRRRIQMTPPTLRFLLPNGSPLEWYEFAAASCAAELTRHWNRSTTHVGTILESYARALKSSSLSVEASARFYAVLLRLDKDARFGDAREKKNALKDALKDAKPIAAAADLAKSWVTGVRTLDEITAVEFPLNNDSMSLLERGKVVEQARGQLEGQWEADGLRSSCSICTKSFNVFRHRHHCRKCGALVCDGCSPGRAALPSMGKKPRRICINCERTASDTLAATTVTPVTDASSSSYDSTPVGDGGGGGGDNVTATAPPLFSLDGN